MQQYLIHYRLLAVSPSCMITNYHHNLVCVMIFLPNSCGMSNISSGRPLGHAARALGRIVCVFQRTTYSFNSCCRIGKKAKAKHFLNWNVYLIAVLRLSPTCVLLSIYPTIHLSLVSVTMIINLFFKEEVISCPNPEMLYPPIKLLTSQARPPGLYSLWI